MCTRSVETVPNTICVYRYVSQTIPTEAKTVTVEYSTPCESQMVTVCDPGYGYGHDVHCKEVAQETCYNKPELLESLRGMAAKHPDTAMTLMQVGGNRTSLYIRCV